MGLTKKEMEGEYMNRRQAVLALLTPLMIRGRTETLSAQSGTATPESSREIDLGGGIVLTDYQFYPDTDYPAFLGVIHNRSGEVIDTPVIGLTFTDDQGNIVAFSYATPQIPVAPPGAHVPVYGIFDEFNPTTDEYSDLAFHLCGDASGGGYTEQQSQLNLELEDLSEEKEDESYLVEGKVRNLGDRAAEDVVVYALFRDEHGRVAGAASTILDEAIPPGETMPFTLDVGVNVFYSADPFDLIDGDYTVELSTGIMSTGYTIQC